MKTAIILMILAVALFVFACGEPEGPVDGSDIPSDDSMDDSMDDDTADDMADDSVDDTGDNVVEDEMDDDMPEEEVVETFGLGDEFTLELGETRVLNDVVSLTLGNLLNFDCSGQSMCINDGKDVKYVLTINGQVYRSSHETPYSVSIVDTDYDTYAKFIVEKVPPASLCGSLRYARDECYKDYGMKFNDPEFCEYIEYQPKKDECLGI